MTNKRKDLRERLTRIQQDLIGLLRTEKKSLANLEKAALGEALIMIKGVLSDWEWSTQRLTKRRAD